MKNILLTLVSIIFLFSAPYIANAQTIPYKPRVEKHCYTVLFPFIHTRCEYRHVKHYTPAPHHRRYLPAPPVRKNPPHKHAHNKPHSHK